MATIALGAAIQRGVLASRPASGDATKAGQLYFATDTGLLYHDNGTSWQAVSITSADLTAIAGLTPANDDLLQRKAGAWTNRTPAQVKTDLALAKGDVGLGNVANLKVNLAATAAPAATDDSGSGYAVGSRWVDTTNKREYVCLDATAFAAVWVETTQVGRITVDEVDGAPSVANVTHITVSNGTLTDDGSGHVTITTGGGGGMTNPMTTTGDLITGGASGTPQRLGIGTANQVLTVSAGAPVWANSAAGFADPTTTKGDLIVHGASTTRLAVGTNGQVLTADSTQAAGVKWAAGGGVARKPLVWQPPDTSGANDDEFEDLSGQSGPVNGLAAAWTKVNLGTPSWLALDDSIAPSCLHINIPNGNAQTQAILRTVPAGDFTLTAVFEPPFCSDREMWGPCIVDASGNGVITVWDQGDVVYIRSLAGWTTTTPAVSIGNVVANQHGQITLSIHKTGTTYAGGAIWSPRMRIPFDVNSITNAFTPAYIGFARVYGTGAANLLLDAIRVN